MKAFDGRLEGLRDQKVLDKKRRRRRRFPRPRDGEPAVEGGIRRRLGRRLRRPRRKPPRGSRRGGSIPRIRSLAASQYRSCSTWRRSRSPTRSAWPVIHEAQLESLRFEMFSPAPIYPDWRSQKSPAQLEQDVAEMGPSDPFLKMFLDGRTPKEAADDTGEGHEAVRSRVPQEAGGGRRSGGGRIQRSDDRAGAEARSAAARAHQVDGGQCPERRAARRRADRKGALRGLRQDALSRCHVYAAPLLRPGKGLPDERYPGAFEDHVLRPVRPRRRASISRGRGTCPRATTRAETSWTSRRRSIS